MSQFSLVQLAKSILEDAQTIENFLTANDLPQPAFDLAGPKEFPVGVENTEIHATRHRLIDSTKELRDLIIGPKDSIKWMIMNV